MRKTHLLKHLDFRAVAGANRGRRPFADAINGEDGRLGEGGRVKRAGGVGLVMFRE